MRQLIHNQQFRGSIPRVGSIEFIELIHKFIKFENGQNLLKMG